MTLQQHETRGPIGAQGEQLAPIPLTDRQMRLYRALWEITEGGAKTCSTNGIYVPGVPAATRKHALLSMKQHGVVALDREGKYRRIRVLVPPDRVKVGTAEELNARHRNLNGREMPLRDDGAFVAALRKASVVAPPDVSTLCLGRFRAQRSDARVL